MTRYEALQIMIKILEVCDQGDSSCRSCPFGVSKGEHIGQCMMSGGDECPNDWYIMNLIKGEVL